MIVPEPIPLDDPPGDPGALEELVRTVAGVSHLLAVLAGDLAGPSAGAPGWLGADATGAAGEIAAAAGLSREMAGAVLLATARLSAFADRLCEARRQIEFLRDEQHVDYLSTRRRLHSLPGDPGRYGFEEPAAAAMIDEFVAGEERRRRRHAALLADVEDRAAMVSRALGEAGAVLGGTGRPGDDARALAHLATLLPGWGDTELAMHGTALARRLDDFHGDPDLDGLSEAITAAARAGLPFAASTVFANALLAELGTDGVRALLTALGREPEPWASPVAILLAAVLGSARPGDSVRDPVGVVVNASYASDDDRSVELTVAGMVAVLAAGSRAGAVRLRPSTVAGWTRHLLLLERSEGRRVGTSVVYTWPAGLSDPAVAAMEALATSGEAEVAADLLHDPDIWQTALARSWDDGGDAFERLVSLLAESGSSGAPAVRAGVEVIGSGLTLGEPSERTVRRENVDVVSSALGQAVAAHIPVAVEALSVGVDGRLDDRETALRGLAYLTTDRGSAEIVRRAIVDWSRAQSSDLAQTSPLDPLPAIAVPSAFIAVEEFGQRFGFALDAYESMEEAEAYARAWDRSIGLVGLLPGAPGLVGGVAADVAAYALGFDGSFDPGPDRGLRFDASDAVGMASSGVSAGRPADMAAVDAQARSAYDRALRALGAAPSPATKERDLGEVCVDAAQDAAVDRLRKLTSLLPSSLSHSPVR